MIVVQFGTQQSDWRAANGRIRTRRAGKRSIHVYCRAAQNSPPVFCAARAGARGSRICRPVRSASAAVRKPREGAQLANASVGKNSAKRVVRIAKERANESQAGVDDSGYVDVCPYVILAMDRSVCAHGNELGITCSPRRPPIRVPQLSAKWRLGVRGG
jgi:hypothetical protein